MPFEFLKYLQPTHYFQLTPKSGKSVFPIVKYLDDSDMDLLELDDHYQSDRAKEYDLSWQAIQKGYIGNAETYEGFEALSSYDNYRFIRKNFHWTWILYVLLIRIISFHNPFKEFTSWMKTRNVRRIEYFDSVFNYNDFQNFHSNLITSEPLVSIVIPTLNRYQYLRDILQDLEAQDFKNFEVIVVDQSDDFNMNFYKDFDLRFQIVHQKEKALWLARNTAIKTANGVFIAFSEDDVRIESNWISQHLKCLDYFDAKVSAGVFYPEGQNIPKSRDFFAVASQFPTGNAMVNIDVFNEVGLFDRQFERQRMGDGEFGLRLYLKGIKSISNPLASCVDLKAAQGGLREMGSWDAFRPSNLFAPRPIPSVLYLYRRYFGKKASRLALLRIVPISVLPYRFKKNKPLLVIGAVLSLLLMPFVILQVIRSWNLASKKINQGPMIDNL